MSTIDSFLNDNAKNPAGGSAAAGAAKKPSEVDAFLSDAPSQARGFTGVARDLAAWGVKTTKVRGGNAEGDKRGRRVVTW